MGFFDLFRPKWKHSDAGVRAEAVRHLGDKDAALLTRIARQDRDARVRRLALKKIDDPGLLRELARDDPDEGLRRAAAEKAAELLLAAAVASGDERRSLQALAELRGEREVAEVASRAREPAVQQAALGRLSDPKALAEVARHAEEGAMRRQAAARISEATVLRDLVLHGPDREVALLAIERIESTAALEEIVKRGQSKVVRGAARERLTALRAQAGPAAAAEPPPEAQRRARQQRLCRTVEAAAISSDWDRATADIEAARTAWAELGPLPADDEHQRRFERACAQFQARREDMQRRLREQAQEAERKAERSREDIAQQAARVALCEQVEKLVAPEADAANAADPAAPAGPAETAASATADVQQARKATPPVPESPPLPQLVEEARAAWSRLAPWPSAQRAELERRFARACDEVLRRGRQAVVAEAQRARLLGLCAEAEALGGPLRTVMQRFHALDKEWRDIEARSRPGPGPLTLPLDDLRQRFARVRERIEALQAEEQARREAELAAAATRLASVCQGLEELAEGDNRKLAERRLKEAQAAFQHPGPLPREKLAELRARYQAIRVKLGARLQELREAEDWKRWANVPRLEQLCVKVEALMEVPDLKQAAKELKAAQAAWKAIGAGPREKSDALWERFHVASDKVHLRCQEYFTGLDESRAVNLKKKEELCQRAEAVVESTDWEATAALLKQLQKEWKETGPAPKEQSDAVWKRFRQACDRFFEQRKVQAPPGAGDEERAENLRRKEELCQKVEAVVESIDWKAAAELIKKAQADWKDIGPVPREQSKELWKRFRDACDRFFARRQVHFDQLDEERGANLKKKEALCETVEALFDSEEHEDLEGTELVKKYMAEWKTTGPAPREQADAVWHRFQRACDRLVERRWEPPPPPPEAGPGKPVSRFENKLPLGEIAQRLAGARSETSEE